MTPYAADLHLHSRFSRASSPQMTIPNLIVWRKRKGIHLLGTGDFTHPEWLGEIEDHLEQDSSGFLKPKEETEIRFLNGRLLPRAMASKGKRAKQYKIYDEALGCGASEREIL